ncbi:MAG TPA: universal stress protein [Anaerolineales bacterium]|nr:universal stress protein [Anaerolineales bacterium]HNO30617.1 universal stress protein [Anaerolineales bacterium]
MYKKILVPLDGSPLAEKVLPHAEAIAKSEGAEIVILRIPAIPSPEFFAREPSIASQILIGMEQEAEQYVNATVNALKEEHFHVTGLTREGPVPDTILAVADEVHADMIAMSTHGRTGVQRWLMGSVADRVVHHAHIPVMLIHPN